MKRQAEPFEVQIDHMIDLLCEGDFTEEGKVRVAELRESWAKAREMIVDQELREMMLTEARRHYADNDADRT
ncbi:hypothetical protein [Tunturiibacter gelidoferens]|uniref:Uncharacterized protein n=1 Tax=Tunturiibacter gelidiferens TaxID=3069689 RepID=A0A9X0QKA5_9BACT|nr:hypothetical protein [Edaphobacter lichenicola]MBB5331888.1 hypothetical protein [Edaphobacter lichenicola]